VNSLLHLIGDVAIWVTLVAAVAFCITYATLAPWRTSGEGWHLMIFTGVIAVAFGWIAYRQAISSPVAALSIEIPRAAILSALAACLIWRLALLVRTQVCRRKRV
jgi:uncharacterized membrane protein HdeD (DUF308 family)